MSTAPARQTRQLLTAAPRLVEMATRRARLSVVPHRRVRAPRVPFVTLVTAILVGGVVGLLCFNTQMQQASFTATTLEQRADSLGARQQTLEQELQRLNSPNHVHALAQKAGLVLPDSSAMLDITTGTVTGTANPATGDATPPLLGRAPSRPASLDPKPTIVKVPAPPVDPAAEAAAAAALAAQQAADAATAEAAAAAAATATADAAAAQAQPKQQGKKKQATNRSRSAGRR